MRMQVIGCGDAFGSGGRAHTCFHFEGNQSQFLVDCGASALIKLKQYHYDPDEIETVVISHLHGDHFGGLVFLLREASLYKKRTKRLTIAGPPGLKNRVNGALEMFFPGGSALPTTYELRFIELEARIPTQIDALQVTGFPVVHPCGAVPYALRIETDGKIASYSADTIWVDELIECATSSDLFICEAYTWEKPMGSHLDYQTVKRRLADFNTRKILLTHLGPEMIERLGTLELDVASDGQIIDF